MKILTEPTTLQSLQEAEDKHFEEMVKAVADIDKHLLAVEAALHADLETLLLENGSEQRSLYGFNICFNGEIVFESMINFPRNREDGYLRAGRFVGSPEAQDKIRKVVDEWIR